MIKIKSANIPAKIPKGIPISPIIKASLKTHFLICFFVAPTLESIPNIFVFSVIEIANGAFENNTSLEEIVFGTGLKIIGESAFQKCTSVKEINLPEGIEKLDIWAFAYMDSLKDIYIPSTLNTIAISSIVQTHNFNVHIKQGSYIDNSISGLMGTKFMNVIYQ